jgi:hypothetical protein
MKYVLIYYGGIIPFGKQLIFSKNVRSKNLKYSSWVIADKKTIFKEQIFSQKEIKKHKPFQGYKKYGIIFKAKTIKGLRNKINEYFLLKEII